MHSSLYCCYWNGIDHNWRRNVCGPILWQRCKLRENLIHAACEGPILAAAIAAAFSRVRMSRKRFRLVFSLGAISGCVSPVLVVSNPTTRWNLNWSNQMTILAEQVQLVSRYVQLHRCNAFPELLDPLAFFCHRHRLYHNKCFQLWHLPNDDDTYGHYYTAICIGPCRL